MLYEIKIINKKGETMFKNIFETDDLNGLLVKLLKNKEIIVLPNDSILINEIK